ncbi:Lipid membrane protein [compost metagenome]
MGNTITVNSSEQVINAMMEVVNTTTANCRSALTQDQIFNIEATGPGSVVNVSDFRVGQSVVVNTRCYQNATTSNNLESQIDQVARQQTEVISQALQLPSIQLTENLYQLNLDLGKKVVNATTQECSNLSQQRQTANIRASEGGTTNVVSTDWNQTMDSVTQCVQNSQAVTNARNALDQFIENNTKATVNNNLTWIIAIVAIIIIIIVIGIVYATVKVGPQAAEIAVKAAPLLL